MRDSRKQQILDACGRMKSAAEIMGFLTAVARMRAKTFPDDPQDSPRLRVSASAALLAVKTGYSRMQVLRAIKLLCARSFITAFKSSGEVTEYRVDLKAIDRWIQPMELFEQDDYDQSPDQSLNVTGTSNLMLPVPVTPCYHHQSHHVTGPPIRPSNSLNIIPGDEDEKQLSENKKAPGTDQEVRPDSEPEDRERASLIQAFAEVNIPQERAEACLVSHTRQKIQAAFTHLRVRLARGDRITKPFGRFILHFLGDPGSWEHELDKTTGEWFNVGVRARQAKVVQPQRPRDSPADRGAMAAAAWNALPQPQRADIQKRVDLAHPAASPALRATYYRDEALTLKEQIHVEEEKQDDPRAVLRGDGPVACHAAGSR